jgi:hypothetical protein
MPPRSFQPLSRKRRVLTRRSGKAPSLPTVRKYYNMDGIPDDFGAALKKDKAFDKEPFKGAISDILTANPSCCVSSVYDVLEERFVESDQYVALPGNAQTLRNYVRHLKDSGAVRLDERGGRTYNYVPDTPPAQQLLIDFGQQDCGRVVSESPVHDGSCFHACRCLCR